MELTSYAGWATDLANTSDPGGRDPDRLHDLATLRDFLRKPGWDQGPWADEATEADLAYLRRLALELRHVYEAHDAADTVDRLNALLRTVRVVPQVSGHDNRAWHLHLTEGGVALSEEIAAFLLTGLAVQVAQIGPERLDLCSLDDCSNVYVDTSTNRSRRYCSDACANRANVRAHRARKRAEAAAGAPQESTPLHRAAR